MRNKQVFTLILASTALKSSQFRLRASSGPRLGVPAENRRQERVPVMLKLDYIWSNSIGRAGAAELGHPSSTMSLNFEMLRIAVPLILLPKNGRRA